jgi:hypothetical protein
VLAAEIFLALAATIVPVLAAEIFLALAATIVPVLAAEIFALPTARRSGRGP